jgi:RND family efflux transporter MFP subunit
MCSGGRIAGVVLLGGALFVVLSGCHRRQVEPSPPVAVHAAALKSESIRSEMRISATAREQRRIEMSFKVPGTIASLLQVPGADGKPRDVHEGDQIVADPNCPLARLDDSDYRRRLSTAEEQLAQAQAKERAAQANVISARKDFDRTKSLMEQSVVSQQEYDSALAKRDACEAELEATQRSIRAASVAQQQAADDLKNCSLVVPIPSAVISRKHIEMGERVAANQSVFQILDVSHVRIAFGVPDTKVGDFRIGQRVSVTADAFRGERFSGRVTKILPDADLKTRSFEIEVTVDEPKGLKPGMVVTILLGETQEALLAPMTAIQRGASGDDYAVFAVVDENGQKVARKRRVLLNGVLDNRIRLGQGGELQAGDTIVVTGGFRLSDGQPVRVVDVPETTLRIGG